MAGEFPEVPNEAKSFNDMVVWAAKHGQAESAEKMLDAVKSQDWGGALDAVHKIEEMDDVLQKAGEFGEVFDTLDKVGKALELADALEKGDYAWVSAKVGAEIVDGAASKYLDSLGPGGIMLNYATHEAGDVLSGYVTEAQQFGPNAQAANASGDGAVVAAYKNNREYMETQIREQLEAGRSPEDVAQWSKDHMEAHGALYKNLDAMAETGDAYTDRFEKDLEWTSQKTDSIAQELDQSTSSTESSEPGFFSQLIEAGAERFEDLKDSLVDALKPDEPDQPPPEDLAKNEPQPEPVTEPEPASQPEPAVDTAPEPVAQTAPDVTPQPQSTADAQANINVNVNVSVATAAATAPIVDAQPIDAQPIEAQPIEAQPSEEQPAPVVTQEQGQTEPAHTDTPQRDPAIAAIEIPLNDPIDYEPLEVPQTPEPVANTPAYEAQENAEVASDGGAVEQAAGEREMTETEKLDAYVSQMAREAEAAEAAEEAKEAKEVEEAPPLPTEVFVAELVPEDGAGSDADAEVYDLADPWDEHSISENYDDTPDDSSHIA